MMTFVELLEIIEEGSASPSSFESICQKLEDRIFQTEAPALASLLVDIGAIPESIAHDSTAEKLFAKAADIILAKSFRELGLQATVNKERADCADVIAKSSFHEYSLVGDAKAFRLRACANSRFLRIMRYEDSTL